MTRAWWVLGIAGAGAILFAWVASAAPGGSQQGDRAEGTGSSRAQSVPAPALSAELNLGGPPTSPRASGKSRRQPSPLNPAAAEFPKPGAKVDARKELASLMAEATDLRSRVAAVTGVLFKSKLNILVLGEDPEQTVSELVIRLDRGQVFSGGHRSFGAEPRIAHAARVAPGLHHLEISVKRTYGKRGFASWQRSEFAIDVPEDKTLRATAELEDSTDVHEEFPDDQDGEYELKIALRLQVVHE